VIFFPGECLHDCIGRWYFLKIVAENKITGTAWKLEFHFLEFAQYDGYFSQFIPEHYTYKSIIIQNLKSTEPQIKSTENILSVDFKSTAKLYKTSKTRCQLASLSKKPKKINLDQL